MRRLISILFFSIFLFAQQGRVISYLSCKWETRTVAHCDCEKILFENVQDDHQQLAKINVHQKWEEPLYLNPLSVSSRHTKIILMPYSEYTDALLQGIPHAPFHPPAKS